MCHLRAEQKTLLQLMCTTVIPVSNTQSHTHTRVSGLQRSRCRRDDEALLLLTAVNLTESWNSWVSSEQQIVKTTNKRETKGFLRNRGHYWRSESFTHEMCSWPHVRKTDSGTKPPSSGSWSDFSADRWIWANEGACIKSVHLTSRHAGRQRFDVNNESICECLSVEDMTREADEL